MRKHKDNVGKALMFVTYFSDLHWPYGDSLPILHGR